MCLSFSPVHSTTELNLTALFNIGKTQGMSKEIIGVMTKEYTFQASSEGSHMPGFSTPLFRL